MLEIDSITVGYNATPVLRGINAPTPQDLINAVIAEWEDRYRHAFQWIQSTDNNGTPDIQLGGSASYAATVYTVSGLSYGISTGVTKYILAVADIAAGRKPSAGRPRCKAFAYSQIAMKVDERASSTSQECTVPAPWM